MTDIETLGVLLRPAGGGIHTVSSGRQEQLALQRRLYGATEDAGIDARWRDALAGLGEAKVAVLGVPSDVGAGLARGAAFGPAALRTAILDQVPDFPARARDAGVVDVGDVFVVPQLLDDEMLSEAQLAATRAAVYGDGARAGVRAGSLPPDVAARLPVSPLSATREVVARLLAINPRLKVLTLGGDHSVAWPVLSALFTARAGRPLAIVHVDAHTDLLPHRLGVKYCFATWAYHANELIGRGGRLVQIGIRASGRPRAHWEASLGVRQLWADEIAGRGEGASLDDVFAHLASLGVEDVYLSNDIDGTDGGLAPATGAPEPGGLSVELVRELIARLGREVSLVGADLVEVAPPLGAPEGARRTVAIGARYVLDSLAALSGAARLTIPSSLSFAHSPSLPLSPARETP